ncbi:hypothetical protein [Shimia biformata]|uniref:hypothetical protein n=1 Tax=Shimia biformata TaxID=1294299 RepID=UPI001950EAE9|nr:hypothetical protein [Shimia biformata]
MNAMNGVAHSLAQDGADWKSPPSKEDKRGYQVSNTRSGLSIGSGVDAVARFVGVLLVLGALIQWTVPRVDLSGNVVHNQIMLSIAFSVIGMAIYAYAIRGHRSEIVLDIRKGEITVNQLTRQDRVRSSTTVPLSRIKSIYVRRKAGIEDTATLQIRHKDSNSEICAIRGDYQELEDLHRQLCHDIRMVRPI